MIPTLLREICDSLSKIDFQKLQQNYTGDWRALYGLVATWSFAKASAKESATGLEFRDVTLPRNSLFEK